MKVYAAISGDLFHRGHVRFLQKARAFGTKLAVGVCSDEEIESYKRKPILTLDDRVAVIKACRFVDEIISSAPSRTDLDFIKSHKIDLVVASSAYSEDVLAEYYCNYVRQNCLRLVDYEQGISTTEIIKRCHQRYCELNGNLNSL